MTSGLVSLFYTYIEGLLLEPGPRHWIRTLKNLGSEKPGPRKTWTQKNLDYEKRGKQLDAKKRLEDHMVQFINIEILLRKASRTSMMEVFHQSI